jgi:hypothetical protein
MGRGEIEKNFATKERKYRIEETWDNNRRVKEEMMRES